jgi:hypothetical protein
MLGRSFTPFPRQNNQRSSKGDLGVNLLRIGEVPTCSSQRDTICELLQIAFEQYRMREGGRVAGTGEDAVSLPAELSIGLRFRTIGCATFTEFSGQSFGFDNPNVRKGIAELAGLVLHCLFRAFQHHRRARGRDPLVDQSMKKFDLLASPDPSCQTIHSSNILGRTSLLKSSLARRCFDAVETAPGTEGAITKEHHGFPPPDHNIG